LEDVGLRVLLRILQRVLGRTNRMIFFRSTTPPPKKMHIGAHAYRQKSDLMIILYVLISKVG
jgi:hypothetical protein